MDVAMLSELFTTYGIFAIFVMVFLEYMNLPGFPAGVIMPLSGIMAANGRIPFWLVMMITILAGLLGSLILYYFGKIGGKPFLKVYIRKFPKQKETLEKNMAWVEQKGSKGVFVAKLIPMIRTLVSIPAGVLQMNLGKYIVSSTLGIFIWNLVFVGAGYLMGDSVFSLLGMA